MPLDDVFTVMRPSQQVGSADAFSLAVEEYTGAVHETVDRRSLTKGWIPVRNVQGTNTIRTDAVGESSLQAIGPHAGQIAPGTTPDGTVSKQGKNLLTIDTLILARESMPLLDSFQQHYDRRITIGREHGKKIAKQLDLAMFTQAIKASLSANSAFFNAATELPGHSGGVTKTLSASGDASDPARLVAAMADLFASFAVKDIDPSADGLVAVVKPATYYALLQAEQLINTDYLTSEGNSVNGMVLKAYGVPIWMSNNYPAGSNVASSILGPDYVGDFTKVVATVFAPKALLAGETIPLRTDVFYDKLAKLWFVDADLAMGVTTDRHDHAGSILIP